MTCQSSGRSPIIAMGFGAVDIPSRIRMPSPPQNSTTFMCQLLSITNQTVWSDHAERRDREDQVRAPGPGVLELPADLLPQVPRQDKDVVRLGLGQLFRRIDG